MTETVLANGGIPFVVTGGMIVILFFFVTLIEAGVLSGLRWGSFRQSFHASVLMNLVSTIAGMVLHGVLPFKKPGSGLVILVAVFVLTVGIEGLILMGINPKKVAKAWTSVSACNVATYLVLVLIIVAADVAVNPSMRGKQKRTMSDMRSIGTAVESYQVDNGFPVQAAFGEVMGIKKHLEPTYIKILPNRDAWKGTFMYFGREEAYTIWSYGKDRKAEKSAGPGVIRRFTCDIIFSNGQFTRYPEYSQH